MFELFFWILQAAIEVYFTIVIYEKINKVKSSFYFSVCYSLNFITITHIKFRIYIFFVKACSVFYFTTDLSSFFLQIFL